MIKKFRIDQSPAKTTGVDPPIVIERKADHQRFAVAVYLRGVGDPSYLEEERIIVYDAETGKAIAAVPSEPLPRTQSWAALSPDGTLLVVGGQSSLRLFLLLQEAAAQTRYWRTKELSLRRS